MSSPRTRISTSIRSSSCPACPARGRKTRARWKDYAEQGGHLIITCRTGQKDRRGHLWEGPWAAPILDLIGAKIKFYDTIPAPYSGKVNAGGQTYNWTSWAEILEPDAGTTVVATYADQFYAGKPAAVTRKLGKGTVTYIGVDSTDGDLEAQLIRDVFTRASVPVENLRRRFSGGLARRLLGRHQLHRKEPARADSAGCQNFIGSRDVPTAGVTVWQE